MKKVFLLFCFIYLAQFTWAQEQFIRTNNNQFFGQAVRITPVKDGGWIVFSTDSLRMLRFDHCAQLIFSNKYILPHIAGKCDIASLMDNGCVILTQDSNAMGFEPVLTKLDSTGNIIWCKSFSNPAYSEQSCSVSLDSSGNIFLVSNASTLGNPNYTSVCKIDFQGNIISDQLIDKGNLSSDVILTSDTGMLIRSGNCFIKTDVSGNIMWSTNVGNAASVFSKPVETGKGFVFSGNVSLAGAVSLIKLGMNGSILIQTRTDFIGLPFDLKVRKNKNISGLFLRTFAGMNYSTMVDLDSNLNFINQKSVSYTNLLTSLTALDIGFLNNDEPVFAGITSPTGNMFYARSELSYSIGCDTILAPIQFINEGVTQVNTPATIFPYSHFVTDLIASKSTVLDSQIMICSVPVQICIGGDTLICGSRPSILQNVTNTIFDKLIWSTGELSSSIQISNPGKYWLTGIGHCNIDTLVDSIDVVKRDLIVADLGDDKYKCESNSLMLKGPDCDHCTYLWNDGSHGQNMAVTTYGKQWLKVDNDGCISSDTVKVTTAKCECQFFIPNTITPNHDGINDLLKPVYYCDLKDYLLRIYNRWGELIYETNDVEQAWDGRCHNIPVPEAVYIYVVTFTSLMEGADSDKIIKTGSLGVVY